MLMTSEQDVEEAAEEWVAAYYNDDAAEEEEVAVTAQPASGAVPLIFSRWAGPAFFERVFFES
jgi:hypothetical protein